MAYMLAVMAWMSLLPLTTDFLMLKLPMYVDPKRVQETVESEQEMTEERFFADPRFDDEDDDDF